MKQIIILSVIAIFFVSCQNNENQVQESKPTVKSDSLPQLPTDEITSEEDEKTTLEVDITKIEQDVLDCLNTPDGMSTFGSIACVNDGEKMWDKGLNQFYKMVQNQCDDNGKKLRKQAQRSWLKYRDAEFDFSATFYDRENGTMALQFNASNRSDIVERRTLQLVQHSFGQEVPYDEDLYDLVLENSKEGKDIFIKTCKEEKGQQDNDICYEDARAYWVSEMNEYLSLLNRILSEDAKSSLAKSQKAWQTFVTDESNATEALKTGDIYKDPAIPFIKILTLYQLTHLRAKELQDYYSDIENGVVGGLEED